jgi:hypothetical protein
VELYRTVNFPTLLGDVQLDLELLVLQLVAAQEELNLNYILGSYSSSKSSESMAVSPLI